jgi:HRDC domain
VLLEIARRPSTSLTDLETVTGFGPARREKYGQEILDVLKKLEE